MSSEKMVYFNPETGDLQTMPSSDVSSEEDKAEEAPGSSSSARQTDLDFSDIHGRIQRMKNLVPEEVEDDPMSPFGSPRDMSYMETRGKYLEIKKKLEESASNRPKQRYTEPEEGKTDVESLLESFQEFHELNQTSSAFKYENHPKFQEMYQQIVQRDHKILDLETRNMELDRQIIDLQDTLAQRDKIINSKNEAVSVVQAKMKKELDGKDVELKTVQKTLFEMDRNFENAQEVWREDKERLNTEISECHKRIKLLEASSANFESTRLELTAQNEELQSQLSSAQEESQTKLEGINSELGEVKAALTKSNAIIAKLKQQYQTKMKAVKEKYSPLEGKIAELENKLVEMEEEKGNLQLQVLELEEKQDKADKGPELEAQVQSLSETKEALEASIAELESRLEAKDSDLKNALSQCEELNAELEASQGLRSKIQELNSALEERSESLQTLEEAQSDLNSKLEELQTLQESLQERDLALSLKHQEFDSLMGAFNEKEELLLHAEAEAVHLKNQVNSLQSEHFELRGELELKDQELRELLTLQSSSSELEARVLSLQQDLEAKERELMDVTSKYQEFASDEGSNAAILRNSLEETQNSLKRCEGELEKVQNEVIGLRISLEESEEALTEKNDTIQGLKSTLEQREGASRSLQARIEELEASRLLQVPLESSETVREVSRVPGDGFGWSQDETGELQRLQEELEAKKKEYEDSKAQLELKETEFNAMRVEYNQSQENYAALYYAYQDLVGKQSVESTPGTSEAPVNTVQMEDLTNQLQIKAQELQMTQNSLQEATEKLQKCQDELAIAQKSVSEVEGLANKLLEVEGELKTAQEKVSEAEEAIESREMEISLLKVELEEIRKDLGGGSELQSQLETLQRVQSELETLQIENRLMMEEMVGFREEKDAIQGELVQVRAERDALEVQFSELEGNSVTLEASTALEKQLAHLRSELNQKSMDLDELGASFEEKKQELIEMKAKLAARSDYEEILTKLDRQTVEFEDLNAEIKRKSTELGEIRAEMASKDTQLSEITSQLSQSQENYAAIYYAYQDVTAKLEAASQGVVEPSKSQSESEERESLQNEVQKLQSELQIAQNNALEAQNLLKSREEETLKLQGDLTSVQDELGKLQASLKSKSDELEAAKADLEQIPLLKSDLADLMEGLEVSKKVKIALNEAQGKLQSISDEKDALKIKLNEIEVQFQAKESELQAALTNYSQLYYQWESQGHLMSQASELNGKLALKEEELADLQRSLDSRDEEMLTLQSRLSEKEVGLSIRVQEVGELKEELEKARGDLEKAKGELGNLEEEFRDLQEMKERYRKTEGILIKKTEESTRELDARNERISNLEGEIQRKDEEIYRLNEQFTQFQSQSSDSGHLQTTLEALQVEYNAKIQEISSLKASFEETEVLLSMKTEELSEKESLAAQMSSELDSLRSQMYNMELVNGQLAQELVHKDDEIRRGREDADCLQTEYASSNNELKTKISGLMEQFSAYEREMSVMSQRLRESEELRSKMGQGGGGGGAEDLSYLIAQEAAVENEKRLKEATATIEELKATLEKTNSSIGKLKVQYQAKLKGVRDPLKARILELENSLKKYEKEEPPEGEEPSSEGIPVQIETATIQTRQIETLEAPGASASEDWTNSEISDLKSQLARRTNEYTTLLQGFNERESLLHEQYSQITSLQAQLGDLEVVNQQILAKFESNSNLGPTNMSANVPGAGIVQSEIERELRGKIESLLENLNEQEVVEGKLKIAEEELEKERIKSNTLERKIDLLQNKISEIELSEIKCFEESLNLKSLARQLEMENFRYQRESEAYSGRGEGEGGSVRTRALQDEVFRLVETLQDRDKRCEELTSEITRLLEERDTLQLKLSNVLKSNVGLNEEVQRLRGDTVESHPPTFDKEELQKKLAELEQENYSKEIDLRRERETRRIVQEQLFFSQSSRIYKDRLRESVRARTPSPSVSASPSRVPPPPLQAAQTPISTGCKPPPSPSTPQMPSTGSSPPTATSAFAWNAGDEGAFEFDQSLSVQIPQGSLQGEGSPAISPNFPPSTDRSETPSTPATPIDI